MARSKITNPTIQISSDDGSALISHILGTQDRIPSTASWLTNLSGYTITCVAKEAEQPAVSGDLPTTVVPQGDEVSLPIINITGNTFDIVLPETLGDNLSRAPIPGSSSYYFFSLKIADTGTGDDQQIWVPARGVIEVLFAVQP